MTWPKQRFNSASPVGIDGDCVLTAGLAGVCFDVGRWPESPGLSLSKSQIMLSPQAHPKREAVDTALAADDTGDQTLGESIASREVRPERPLPEAVRPGTVADDQESAVLWLRRADQWLLGCLLIALLVLLIAFRWKLSGGGRTEIEIINQQPREYYYAIDVNNASWVEWAQLDGIGEKMARRIVQDRDDNGPFHSVEDIRRVRGFGPKLIEKLRPFLRCAADQPEQSTKSPPVILRDQISPQK